MIIDGVIFKQFSQTKVEFLQKIKTELETITIKLNRFKTCTFGTK